MSVAIQFNARTVAPGVGGGGVQVYEAGKYLVAITNSEKKPVAGAGNENKFYLEFELTFQAGELQGSKYITRLNLWNDKPQAVEIAAKELSAICHVTGVMDMTQTGQLHGRPFGIRISKDPNVYQDRATGEKREGWQNNIREYFDAHGRTLKEILAGLGGSPQPGVAQQPPGPVSTQQPSNGFGGAQPGPAPAGFTPGAAAPPAPAFGPGAAQGTPPAVGPQAGPAPGAFGAQPAGGAVGAQPAPGPAAGAEPQWR